MTRSAYDANNALSMGARQPTAYDRVGRNALVYKPRIEARKPMPTMAQRIARFIIGAL